MAAQSREFHIHLQGISAGRLRHFEFEYSFIFAWIILPLTHRTLELRGPRFSGFAAAVKRGWLPRCFQFARLRSILPTAGVLLLLLSLASGQPFAEEQKAELVRREILAIYDSRDEARPDLTMIHRFAEMVLNHLGFAVSYWDIQAGLPNAQRTANIMGIVTWFRRPPPSAFYPWGLRQVANGVRMAVIGHGGLPSGHASLADANRLFGAIGFGFSGGVVDITYGTRVLHRDALIGFERPLDPVLPAFPIIGTFGPEVVSHLVLEHRESNQVLASSVVLTSSRGGYAANEYFIYEEPISGRTKWIVDPFAFFQKAFGAQIMPIPDVTTLSGRRIWFSHIDGDGWNNVSYVEAYRDKPTIAAAVILRELIAPYPDLPVAVGVIGADIDERYGTPEAGRQAARDLYALPQVEVASHTYSHPYQWSFFENYDPGLEQRLIAPDATEWKAVLGDRMRRLARRLFPGLARRAGELDPKLADEDPPRAYSNIPFDLDNEIRGAVTAAEDLAPAGKHGTIYLWSGQADPFEEAIARTRRLGVRNINGGDSRYDADYPSLSYLSPISRVAGAERQIYAANANDFLYINDGGGREHGFLHLEATVKATENPRRLKPINVYYHMYAGERAAQLAGVRHHLDAARQASITPIAASHYAAIADGYFSTAISALGNSSWLIRDRGSLQTVRFDGAQTLAVDFSRSVGVIGQRKKGASLYVALDEAHEEVIVALGRAGPAGEPPVPYLVEGRWTFRDLRRLECGFTVMAKGYGIGQMTWGGLKPGLYHVMARNGGERVWEEEIEVGDDGRLAFTADADAITPLEIDVGCLDEDDPP